MFKPSITPIPRNNRVEPIARSVRGSRAPEEVVYDEQQARIVSQGRRPDGTANAHYHYDDVLPREPYGFLFEVKFKGKPIGFFDLLGYFCREEKEGRFRVVRVYRNAPRNTRRLMNKDQIKMLTRAQLNARRKKLR